MSQTSKQKLSEVLKELRSDYLTKFPKKIDHLRKLTEARCWKDLEDEYHKLKGTGSTYGFPDVSTVCEIMESLAQNKYNQKPEIFEQTITLLERMHQNYVEGKVLDLSSDTFARTLLALRGK